MDVICEENSVDIPCIKALWVQSVGSDVGRRQKGPCYGSKS